MAGYRTFVTDVRNPDYIQWYIKYERREYMNCGRMRTSGIQPREVKQHGTFMGEMRRKKRSQPIAERGGKS